MKPNHVLALASLLACVCLPAAAFADDPAAATTPTETPSHDEPKPGRVTVEGVSVTAAPWTGAANDEPHTMAQLLATELGRQKAAPGSYEIELGRLGAKWLCTLRRTSDGRERTILLASADEVFVAAPRLVDSLLTAKSTEQSATPETIVRDETRQSLVKSTAPGFYLGLIGMAAAGAPMAASGGVDLGLSFHHKQLELALHGRAGGLGSGEHKASFVGLDLGASYNLLPGNIAPFVGGGLGFGYFDVGRAGDGSGLVAYANAGVNLYRTSHVGLSASVRADLPVFTLDNGSGTSRYVVPLSLNLGLTFR